MKKLLAVALALAMILLPCGIQGSEGIQSHYFLIGTNGEQYSAFPLDDSLKSIFGQSFPQLEYVLSLGLEDLWDILELGRDDFEPFGLLIHSLTQTLDGISRLDGDYPVILNHSHLTAKNTVNAICFSQGLYLLESSLKILVEESSNKKQVTVKEEDLITYGGGGRFHFPSQGSLTLRGDAPKLNLPQNGATDLTPVMQRLDSLTCSYGLEGEVEIRTGLALAFGQELSLEQGGTLHLPGGAELLLNSGTILNNKGSISGSIRNQGRVNNAQGAVIGGGYFCNLKDGQVYNAGVITSSPIVTQKGSTITNLGGGSLATVPTGEGEYPGKKDPAPPAQEKPAHPSSGDDDDDGVAHPATNLPVVQPQQLDKTQVAFATYTAIHQALEQQNQQAVIRLLGSGKLSAEGLQALWEEEQKFPLVVYSFSPRERGRGVGVRLAIKPSALPGPCDLSASTFNRQAVQTRELFHHHFGGSYQVVSLGYQGDFAKPVEVAAKLDLSGFDLETLYFYAYHPPTNTYRQIEHPQHWVDSRGFLHFYTAWGGDLLVTDVRLP